VTPAELEDVCDFCPARYRRTTPEKSRLVPDGDRFRLLERVPAGRLRDTRAAFRRIGNLFEIVTFDYWARNHGHCLDADREAWLDSYLRDPEGEAHLRQIVAYKLRCLGRPDSEVERLDRNRLRDLAAPFFGGSHELVLAERHYRRDARTTDDLASSGSLSPGEHLAYVRFTLGAAAAIARENPHVRHVAVFQNWLAGAGASFDHLHKQLMGLDREGEVLARRIELERREPDAFNRYGLDFALDRGLVVASNEGAVVWADVGHRFPTLTIASRSAVTDPAALSEGDLAAFSDLLHACHAAMGPALPCNEEWHFRPARCPVPIPLHVHLKWRVHRSAGFEGMTRVHIVPLLPEEVRDRTRSSLETLLHAGVVRNVRPGGAGLDNGALAYRRDPHLPPEA
jgi:galactose-1-phosphate uridylyltransferase